MDPCHECPLGRAFSGRELLAIFALIAALLFVLPAAKAETPRRLAGEQALLALSQSDELPAHVRQLEREFPEMAHATIEYALGDVWGREVLDPKTRQLVALSALAAEGAWPQFKLHATYALGHGATPEELLEVTHLLTVTSGFPAAMNATQALKEVFAAEGIDLPLPAAK
ncbi:MAG: carboxymuconolactone decarboxylase family protein [Verrucomicrobiota bacterium JB022]|nr:carboxymuconolactone decarboxylase family protein [Verrucomicrobiota bacterium JB022]